MSKEYVCVKTVIIDDDREDIIEDFKNKFIVGNTYEFTYDRLNNFFYLLPCSNGNYLFKKELKDFFLTKEEYRDLKINKILNNI